VPALGDAGHFEAEKVDDVKCTACCLVPGTLVGMQASAELHKDLARTFKDSFSVEIE